MSKLHRWGVMLRAGAAEAVLETLAENEEQAEAMLRDQALGLASFLESRVRGAVRHAYRVAMGADLPTFCDKLPLADENQCEKHGGNR